MKRGRNDSPPHDDDKRKRRRVHLSPGMKIMASLNSLRHEVRTLTVSNQNLAAQVSELSAQVQKLLSAQVQTSKN